MYEEELNLEDKKKFSLWLQQETFDMVEKMYRNDNCTSRSEFIEKAIKLYCGFLRNMITANIFQPFSCQPCKLCSKRATTESAN